MATLALGIAASALTAGASAWVVAAAGVAAAVAGSYIDSLLLGSSSHVEGPRLSDLSVATADYGSPIAFVYGTSRVAGQVIWSAGLKERAVTTEVGGGKGGGSSSTQTQYYYSTSVAIALCKGPIVGITRMWGDGKLLWEAVEDAEDEETPIGSWASMTVYAGTEDQEADPVMEAVDGIGNVPGYRGTAYVVIEDMELADFGNRLPNITFEVVTARATAASVIYDLTRAAGLAMTEVDASGVETIALAGYGIGSPSTARQCLDPVLTAYQIFASERDGALVFRRHALKWPGMATLETDDLAGHEFGRERPDPIEQVRPLESDLPRQVDLTFVDPERDYQTNTARARHLVTESLKTTAMDTPVVLTSTQALQAAQITLFKAFADARTFKVTADWSCHLLAPGDNIHLSHKGRRWPVRINNVALGLPGLLELTCAYEDVSIYTVAAEGYSPPVAAQTPYQPGDATLYFLDIPILRDIDDDAGFYLAVDGDDAWRGARVFRSADGGANWSALASLPVRAIAGSAIDVLGSGPTAFFDHGNSVTVEVGHGTLSSKSEAEVINWANLAVLGDELIQFTTAILIASNTWRLSGLLRGRRGTEWAVDGHQVGDTFLLIDAGALARQSDNFALVGLERDYRAVTKGQQLDDADIVSFVNTARGLKPYSPAHFGGARNNDGDIALAWVRRARYGGEWKDLVDVPLCEAYEAYEVDVIASSIVVRVIETSAPSAVYTAAQQTADGVTPGDPVTFRVYQLSDKVGRGYASTVTV